MTEPKPSDESADLTSPIDRFEHDYRYLSNFWPAKVYYGVQSYTTIEHAYQAAKTKNVVFQNQIRLAESPFMAKRLGRNVPIREDWEKIKLEVMADLLWQKFIMKPEMRAKLVATGKREIIEGNTWGDRYWGMCEGTGENHLGRLLMALRVVAREVGI
jgi:ribA/ribD-fused uncharacterized protein